MSDAPPESTYTQNEFLSHVAVGLLVLSLFLPVTNQLNVLRESTTAVRGWEVILMVGMFFVSDTSFSSSGILGVLLAGYLLIVCLSPILVVLTPLLCRFQMRGVARVLLLLTTLCLLAMLFVFIKTWHYGFWVYVAGYTLLSLQVWKTPPACVQPEKSVPGIS